MIKALFERRHALLMAWPAPARLLANVAVG
jgi:hypothetical protein